MASTAITRETRITDYAQKAIRLGVPRFLLKPSNMDELEEAISAMCEVAEKTYVSQWHLSKLLNRHTGQSFSDILNHCRIEHAKKLLEDPSLRIGDISDAVGFLDLAHFSRVFKKQEGMSANEWRNQKLGS